MHDYDSQVGPGPPRSEHHSDTSATRHTSRVTLLIWNVCLALVWAFGVGQFTLANVIVGFVLGYVALWLGSGLFHSHDYCAKLPQLLGFLSYFLWELLLANFRVARDVLAPRPRMQPGILALPLAAKTDLEIMLLANFLGLTPGTLALDVSPDRRTLYIHAMFVSDPEQEKERIKSGYERRLLELMR